MEDAPPLECVDFRAPPYVPLVASQVNCQPDRTCRENPTATRTYNAIFGKDKAGKLFGEATKIYRAHKLATASKPWNPWAPFANSHDFSLARWMIVNNIPKEQIKSYLNSGLDRFESPDIKDADCIRDGFADYLWETTDHGAIETTTWLRYDLPTITLAKPKANTRFEKRDRIAAKLSSRNRAELEDKTTVYYRDVMKCIQLLLGQLAFKDHMDYQPVQLYDDSGNRVYNEISSGNWWWKTQQEIPDGGTLIPVLLASDKTQLTTYSGDKSGWPLYMSIGNIRKDVRRKTSNNAWILIGLLPIPPKGCGRALSDEIFHRSIDRILQPLAAVDPKGNGYEFHCGDGNIRRGYPIIAAWIGDYPEYRTITGCINMLCPVCEIPAKEMGHANFKPKRQYDPNNPQYCSHRERKKEVYQEMIERKADPAAWAAVGMRPGFCNPLWKYPLCDIYRLWQPDELHVFFIGLVKTLIGEWLIPFCAARDYERRFHRRFQRVPRYPNLKRFKKAFHEVQSGSWQGKEMRMMARFLNLVVGPMFYNEVKMLRSTLRKIPTLSQNSEQAEKARRRLEELESASKTVRALCEAVLLVGQRSHTRGKNPVAGSSNAHTWGSLEYLDSAIEAFQTHKVVFVDEKNTPTREEARKNEFRILEKAHADKYGLEVGRWKTPKHREAAIKESISLSAMFAAPKIHMIMHISKAIEDMGSADNFTTDISELLHKNMIKSGYNASNKKEFEKQILWYCDRITGLSYMEQNLRHLALEGYYDRDSAFVLGLLSESDRKQYTRSKCLERSHRSRQIVATKITTADELLSKIKRMNNARNDGGNTGTPPANTNFFDSSQDYSRRWPYSPPGNPSIPTLLSHYRIHNLPPTKLVAEVRGSDGNYTLWNAQHRLDLPKLTKLFRDCLIHEWTEEIFYQVYPREWSLEEFGKNVAIRLYNGIKCYSFDFHPPHEAKYDVMKCIALPGKERREWGEPQSVWVRDLVEVDDSGETFQGKRVCFPYLYFGFIAPPGVERFAMKEGQHGRNFRCKIKWSPLLYRYQYIPQMMGFALVNVADYAKKDSTPESFHGMVHIKREKRYDFVIRVEDIERAAHAMLVDEETKDPQIAEYAVNNLVDGFHYWNFY